MADWRCTECGAVGGEPATKLLDRSYGTQACIECKKKRIFHQEVNHDDRSVHLPSGQRPPERGA